MKLNMWQRFGIVLSVLWIIGMVCYRVIDRGNSAAMIAGAIAHQCDQANGYKAHDACWANYARQFSEMADGRFADGIVTALLPLPFAWLIAYVAVWTTRWIRQGRSTKNSV